MSLKPHWIDMKRQDFADIDRERTVAVLPIAAIEQHGPHLPVSVDTHLAEGLTAETLKRLPDDLPATFLPVQAVGKSNEHIMAPGTITIAWDTAYKYWYDIAESIARTGIKRLVIVTSHGGNVALTNVLARDLRIEFGLFVVATGWYNMGVPDNAGYDPEELRRGIHGGDMETSMMLHLRPDLVDMAAAADFPMKHQLVKADYPVLNSLGPLPFAWIADDLNDTGAAGDASRATAERGEATLVHQAEKFIALLKEVSRFELSLLSPYAQDSDH